MAEESRAEVEEGGERGPLLPGGRPTLGLHARPDQGQRVAGQLPTGAGGGPAGQQQEHAGVGALLGKVLQPPVLQGLRGGAD